MKTSTAARSDKGRVREGNEDRFLVREDGGTVLLAVADGVAGEAGGEIAAQAAVDELARRFYAARGRAVGEALAEAVREANGAVLRAAESSGNRGAATTLVAAAIHGREAAIANLGDSRAYVVRAGAPRQITEDHSGDTANSITRFVGDERGVQPDVFAEAIALGDRLVLCSDGLTRHVSDAEIASAVRSAPPETAADALVALALERGGEDNVTVVVYEPGRERSRGSLGLFLFGVFVAFVLVVSAAAAALLAGD